MSNDTRIFAMTITPSGEAYARATACRAGVDEDSNGDVTYGATAKELAKAGVTEETFAIIDDNTPEAKAARLAFRTTAERYGYR